MAARQNPSCPLSPHSAATSAESCGNVHWKGNAVESSELRVQCSAGGGRKIAGPGVKLSGWTTEATARKLPDFYPTAEAEQEIRRAAGESIKRIIQFQILFWKITETKHQYLLLCKYLPFNDITFWINPRSSGPCSGTWIELFLSSNFHCFLLLFVFWFSSYNEKLKALQFSEHPYVHCVDSAVVSMSPCLFHTRVCVCARVRTQLLWVYIWACLKCVYLFSFC